MQCSLPFDGRAIETGIDNDWEPLLIFKAVSKPNISCVSTFYVFGATKVKGTNKRSKRGGNSFQNSGFTLPVTCGNDREVRMKINVETFESTEILEFQFAQLHRLTSGCTALADGFLAGS